MQLLLSVPTLMAHSNLRYESWRQAIAEFVGRRLGVAADSRLPTVTGWAFLALSLAAYEQWLQDERAELVALIDASLDDAQQLFGGRLP